MENLELGFKQARLITKEHAKTFYFASHFLSKEQADASYSVYAVCRISDDSVDISKNKLLMVAKIEDKIKMAYSEAGLEDDCLTAFRNTVNRYKIPKHYFDELLSGVKMDLNKTNYADFEQLKQYCYKVAGVVGLMMLKILGSNSKKAEEFAVDLGIAMQLTNILRDIKEDFNMDRIYLPKDEMKKFKIDQDLIKKGTVNQDFIDFMQFQIKRARYYYKQAEQGICLIKSMRCRLVTILMSKIYAGILTSIEKNNYDVFTKRAHTNILDKISIVISTLLRFKYLKFKNHP
jgi:phytoene synthase